MNKPNKGKECNCQCKCSTDHDWVLETRRENYKGEEVRSYICRRCLEVKTVIL